MTITDPIYPGKPPYPSKEDSPYYWWYEYLKRVKDYGPKHRLYNDFGNLKEDFQEWFEKNGARLFAEPHIEVTAKATDNELILTIPLALTMKEIQVQIKTILGIHHFLFHVDKKKSRKGRKSFKDSKAKYPLHVTPITHGLKKTLRVYDLKQQGLTHIEIAKRMNLLRGADKVTARIVVSRYLKHARGYIKNVGCGVFPKK